MIFKLMLTSGNTMEVDADSFKIEPAGVRFFSSNGESFVFNEHIRGRVTEKDGKLVQIDDPAVDRLLSPKDTPTFQPGQVVQLRSGGPRMTVSEVEAGHVATLWFDGATLKKEVWVEVLLKPVEDQP